MLPISRVVAYVHAKFLQQRLVEGHTARHLALFSVIKELSIRLSSVNFMNNNLHNIDMWAYNFRGVKCSEIIPLALPNMSILQNNLCIEYYMQYLL